MYHLTALAERVFPPISSAPAIRWDSLYRFVWSTSARQQWRLCLLAVVLFPLSLAPLELQRLMVDCATDSADIELLLTLGILYLLVLVIHGACKYAYNVYQSIVGEGVVRALRGQIPATGGASEQGGARAALASAEVEQVGGFTGEALAFPFLQAGLLLSVLGYMLWLQPLMALAASISVVPSVLLIPVLQAHINRHVARRVALVRRLGNRLSDAKTTSRGPDAGRMVRRLSQQAYRRRVRIFLLKFLLKALNNFLAASGPLVILLIGGWLVITSDVAVGTLVAFVSGFERLTSPARELLNFYRRVTQVKVQYKLVADAVVQC